MVEFGGGYIYHTYLLSYIIIRTRFDKFISMLKAKGVFDGVAEGTPEYAQKLEAARAKFNEKYPAAPAPAAAPAAQQAPATPSVSPCCGWKMQCGGVVLGCECVSLRCLQPSDLSLCCRCVAHSGAQRRRLEAGGGIQNPRQQGVGPSKFSYADFVRPCVLCVYVKCCDRIMTSVIKFEINPFFSRATTTRQSTATRERSS
jgi:hypothetical protein